MTEALCRCGHSRGCHDFTDDEPGPCWWRAAGLRPDGDGFECWCSAYEPGEADFPAADGRSSRKRAGDYARAVLARSDRLVALRHARLAGEYIRLRAEAEADRRVRWQYSAGRLVMGDPDGATEAERKQGCPAGWYRRRM